MKVAFANGNWNTAGTWRAVSNTPTVHQSTSITLAAADKLSATFTAPGVAGETSLGCVFGITTWNTASTITVALQEDSGAGFVDVVTGTVTKANMGSYVDVYQGYYYFVKWATPYAYAVATANKYRYAFRRDAGSPTVFADSGGSLVHFADVNSNTGVPSGEDVVVIGANETGTVTVTVDQDTTLSGSGSGSSGVFTTGYLGRPYPSGNPLPVNISGGGTITFPTDASITLTVDGIWVGPGGSFISCTEASPLSLAYIHTISIISAADSQNRVGVADYGTFKLNGHPVYTTDTFAGTFVSGTGTAADPVIISTLKELSDVSISIASPGVVTYTNHGLTTDTPILLTTDGALPTGLSANTQYYVKKLTDDTFELSDTPGGTSIDTSGTQSGTHTLNVNWRVGDEIVFAARQPLSAGYTNTEFKFIKTVNSATSYVLADTAGGAESALTKNHDEMWIINTTRNIIINRPSSGFATKIWDQTNSGNVNVTWVRFDTVYGYIIPNNCECHYSVMYKPISLGFYIGAGANGTSSIYTPVTLNGLCVVGALGSYAFYMYSSSNVTMNYFYTAGTVQPFVMFSYIGNNYTGQACTANTLNYCYFSGSTTNSNYGGGGFCIRGGGTGNVFNNCEFQAVGAASLSLCGATNNTFNNCKFNTKTTVTAISQGDICIMPKTNNSVLFNNCLFGSDTLVYGYTDSLTGTDLRFFQHNQTANKNFWYTKEGIFTETGTGLTDTTVRTAGGFGVRMAPETALSPYQNWSFKVPTGDIQNKSMTIAVWCKINAAAFYAGNYQLPRLTINYDYTTTGYSTAYSQAAEATGWQLLFVTITPTTTYPEIEVKISAGTDATSTDAYVYWDDMSLMYPPGVSLNLGTMDYWSGETAKPVVPPIATALSAADVWTAASTTDWGNNTMGSLVKITEHKVDDNAALILSK